MYIAGGKKLLEDLAVSKKRKKAKRMRDGKFSPVLPKKEQPTNVHLCDIFSGKIFKYSCADIRASANVLDPAILKPLRDNDIIR